MELNTIHLTDALNGLKSLPDESVDCIVTSPPYWQMRDYGIGGIEWPDGWFGQLGLEPTRDSYIAHLCHIFDECRRVLKSSGSLWETHTAIRLNTTDRKRSNGTNIQKTIHA